MVTRKQYSECGLSSNSATITSFALDIVVSVGKYPNFVRLMIDGSSIQLSGATSNLLHARYFRLEKKK